MVIKFEISSMVTIYFVSDGLLAEYRCQFHSRTRAVMLELAYWLAAQGYAPLLVTDIARTAADDRRIYGDKPDHTPGPHVIRPGNPLSRAFDLRSYNRPDAECDAILYHLNKLWRQPDYNYPTALRHNVGAGDHIHVQTPPD